MAKFFKTQVAYVTVDDLTIQANSNLNKFNDIDNVTWQCVRDKEIIMSSGIVIFIWNNKSKILKPRL